MKTILVMKIMMIVIVVMLKIMVTKQCSKTHHYLVKTLTFLVKIMKLSITREATCFWLSELPPVPLLKSHQKLK